MISSVSNSQQNLNFKALYKPSAKQAKVFFEHDPLLAKFVPQHCYGFQKYDGSEATRFMKTDGCATCSKLAIYDKSQKLGFYSHLDFGDTLLSSFEKIKEGFKKRKMQTENLFATHTKGLINSHSSKNDDAKKFLKMLGLKDEQIKINVDKDAQGFHGGVLDLKDGKNYDLDVLHTEIELIRKIHSLRKPAPNLFERALSQQNIRNHKSMSGWAEHLDSKYLDIDEFLAKKPQDDDLELMFFDDVF